MRISGIIVGMCLLASCSVKEVRDACPCLLVLDFAEYGDAVPMAADLLISDEDGKIWEDVLDLSLPTGYSVYVPKTMLHLHVWTGDEELFSEEGMNIPSGCDCPEIYMYHANVVAAGETVTDTVRMRKNHCVMRIRTEGEGDFPFEMKIIGNICGYDGTGEPVEGKFACAPDRDGDSFRVVLPRQTDDSLMLMVEGDDVSGRAFAVGQYLAAGGYDWTAPDLEDVIVTIDYALTEVRVVVNGWESVYAYDVIM